MDAPRTDIRSRKLFRIVKTNVYDEGTLSFGEGERILLTEQIGTEWDSSTFRAVPIDDLKALPLAILPSQFREPTSVELKPILASFL